MPKTKNSAANTLPAEHTIHTVIQKHVHDLMTHAMDELPADLLSYVMSLETSILQVIYDFSGQTAQPFCQALFSHYSHTDSPREAAVSTQVFVESVITSIVQATVAVENKAALLQVLQQPNMPSEVRMTAFVKAVVAAADWDRAKLASDIIKICDSVSIKKEILKKIAHIDVQVLTNPKALEKIDMCHSILKDLVNTFDYQKEWEYRDTQELMEGIQPHALEYLKRNILKVVVQENALLKEHKAAMLLSLDSGTSMRTSSSGLFTSIQSTNTQGTYLGSPSSVAPTFFGGSKEGEEDIEITRSYSPRSPGDA